MLAIPKYDTPTFVTIVGWIFIVFTALGVTGTLMQNVMVNFVFPRFSEEMSGDATMPFDGLIVFRIFAGLILAISVFSLYASWSFLHRRNWARRAFVVFLTLGAAWAAFVFLGFGIAVGIFNLPAWFAGESAEFPAGAAATFRVMGLVFGCFAAGIGTLFVWLIKRLRSPEVRSEFQPVLK